MIRATAPERSRFAKQFWQKRTAHYGKIGAGQAKGIQGEIGIQTCSSSSMGRALLVVCGKQINDYPRQRGRA
jgi:hypothetical protein